MKKRLISVLLTVLMVMSLFSGMSLSAYADNTTNANTVQYQMVNGDNVFMICQRLGINFYDCKAAIMKLNGITDGMWSSLPVGKVLTLPASNVDGIKIGSGGIGGTTVTTGSGANASTAQISATVSDPVAYYLIPYTMSRGETVSGVCNQLGINFNAYSEQIKKINGITNWTKVNAGSQLLLPSAKAPAVGTSCYAVLAHKVVKDETAYSIASSKGVSYAGNKALLQALNNTNNLNKIKTGDNFYVPVATTIAPAGVSGSTTGTGTATTTSSSGTSGSSSGTSGSTTPAAKTYKLTTNINSAAGTLQFYVNNKAVTQAAAGDKVTVVAEMNKGKALKSMTVKHLDGKGELLLTGDTFIMPSCDVRVDVEVQSGYDINITANYTGKAAANVGGIAVTSAVKDAKVFIVSTDPSYEVESATVTYKKLLGGKTEVPVSESMGFVMPDAKVNVEVKLKPVTTYDFYVNDPDHGSFFLQVNGSNVSKAAKGAQVTIVTKSQEGFEPTMIEVWRLKDDGSDDKQISVINGKFTMPAADVRVEVLFSAQGNNIVFMPAKGGSATAEVDGSTVNEADTGVEVTLVPNAETGYSLKRFDVARNSDGYKVKVTSNKFSMPSGGVTVTPVFEGDEHNVDAYLYIGNAVATEYSSCSFFTSDGKTKAEIQTEKHGIQYRTGDYIDLSTEETNPVGFDRFEIYVDGASEPDAELTNQANLKGYFEMPDDAVEIRAYFVNGFMHIGAAAITGKGTVSYSLPDHDVSVLCCQPGDTVIVNMAPSEGYSSGGVKVTRKDTGAELPLTKIDNDHYSFVIPAEGVNVQATFNANMYKLTMRTVNETGADLSGEGIWQISISGSEGVVENSTTNVKVPYGARVTVSMTAAGRSKYSMIKLMIDGVEYTHKFENYNYNFPMVGEFAKDMEIVATVRSVAPVNAKLYTLDAGTYDWNKGTIEYVIRDSAYPFDASETEYVKQAHGGDTVAIVPTLTAGYDIDSDHITITRKDGGVIHPTEVTLATGKTAYEFVMPNDGYKSIYPDFFAKSYPVEIYVTDADDNTKDYTTLGLVRFNYNEGNFNDVNDKDGLGTIQYGATVNVLISSPGVTQGWEVVSIEGNPSIASSTKPVTNVSSGYQFTMPAKALKLQVNLKGGTVPPTPPAPIDVKLPATAKDGSNTYNLQYYKDAAMTEVLTDLNVKSGETYYVKVMNPPDGGELSSFAFKDGTKEIGNADTSSGMFTVPSDAASPTAEVSFNSNSYKVVVSVVNAPDTYTVAVKPGSDSEVTVTPDSTQVDVTYGETVKITVTGDREIDSVEGLDSFTLDSGNKSGSGTLKPADSVPDGSVVTVTVKFKVVHKLKLTYTNDAANSATIEINGTAYSDSGEVPDLAAGDTITFANASREIESVEGLDGFTLNSDMKGGSATVPDTSDEEIAVTVKFASHIGLKFKFVNDIGGSNKVKVNGTERADGETVSPYLCGEEITLSDSTRKISTVTGLDGFVRDSGARGGKGKTPSDGNDGDEYEVTITFAKLNYNLKLKISGAAAAEDNAVRLYSASNPLRSDGNVSGPYYVDEHVPVFAPEGYHFKSISSPVITNVSIDSGDAWHSATFDVKENSTYNDGDEIYLTIVLEADPS